MKGLLAGALLCILAGSAMAQAPAKQAPIKRRRPLPYEYGRVILNNYSEGTALGPVVFEHWSHRARFTCRLCHVDVGFAQKANATGIHAADNMRGYYCGACHNGKTLFEGKTVFESCSRTMSDEDQGRCERCHSYGKSDKNDTAFQRLAQPLPKERFGNGIDWQQAEEQGLIHPADFEKGISIKRKPLAIQKDFALNPKVEGMPDIIFSHKKHTVWSGCEGCHPEIFVGVKRGATHYSMAGIFEGKYCGVCHTTVAFPLMDCQRCHSKPVQQP